MIVKKKKIKVPKNNRKNWSLMQYSLEIICSKFIQNRSFYTNFLQLLRSLLKVIVQFIICSALLLLCIEYDMKYP